ncbi:MAG: 16S rRNA (guanine(527)-N(7))-methyltransferase RsmG [Bacteroidetes bacterium]|nr:16S rRNA (guanine(527)-N(7))-methyltransferase RsmG [Bacteroidota bacterium]
MVDQAKTIKAYFPELDQAKANKLLQLEDLYRFWNDKINVISRKDINNLFLHHILHSLTLLKYDRFTEKSTIIDIGTGGGFPGIPLAVAYPNCRFSLVDSRNKKIKVVTEISEELELNNIEAMHSKAEDLKLKFDYALGRAVSNLRSFTKLASRNLNPTGIIYYWTGREIGDFVENKQTQLFIISESFHEPYFKNKVIVKQMPNIGFKSA